MKYTIILLGITCALAFLTGVQAECCRASLTMSYTVGRGRNCADAGGRRSGSGCTITVCANGRAQVGTFCGRRSCNIFGCACGGGCLRGNWKDSFIANYRNVGIRVTGEKWNT